MLACTSKRVPQTDDYKANRAVVIRILNEALATEIVCVLRYKRHHYMAKGIHSLAVEEEFPEHAKEEQGHADKSAERITQLDGEPNFDPAGDTQPKPFPICRERDSR